MSAITILDLRKIEDKVQMLENPKILGKEWDMLEKGGVLMNVTS